MGKGLEEGQSSYRAGDAGLASVDYVSMKIDSAGRIVIPAEMRAAMLVNPGDSVTGRVVDGEFRLISPTAALKRVQVSARQWKAENPGVSVVDELIADRREEARREDERYQRIAREAVEMSPR